MEGLVKLVNNLVLSSISNIMVFFHGFFYCYKKDFQVFQVYVFLESTKIQTMWQIFFFPRFILSPTHISGLYTFVVSLSSYITNSVRMQVIVEMVFCFENCSDLLWEKIVLVIKKTKQWKVRTIFKPEYLVNGSFYRSNRLEQSKSQLVQIIGVKKPTGP